MPWQPVNIKKNLGFYGKLWEINVDQNWDLKQIT